MQLHAAQSVQIESYFQGFYFPLSLKNIAVVTMLYIHIIPVLFKVHSVDNCSFQVIFKGSSETVLFLRANR